MKRFFDWKIILGLVLILFSAAIYFVHYLIFRDAHHIFIYLIGDIAFVFLEVLMVTMVLHQLLHYRERKTMMNKLNMVIGVFFSEVGTELLKDFSVFDTEAHEIIQKLSLIKGCSGKEFSKICKSIKKHKYSINSKKEELDDIKSFLKEKRQFLLTLLENPNLLEHEEFTNLLWAVFHLTEELIHRKSLIGLPETDYQHLAGDIKRVYQLLIVGWVSYMEHLKDSYPYLFSLAARTNPFDEKANVILK